MTVTIAIIVLTVLISLSAENNYKVKSDLAFVPTAVHYRKQWYRFITGAFVHSGYMHLAFNMYALYMFGQLIEMSFMNIFGVTGKLVYALLYLTAAVACDLPNYAKHKDNYGFSSVGASGAISAVSFCFMLLYPAQKMGIIFIPFLKIPAFLFAPLFLIATSYMAKQENSRIDHSAHLWGAIYGMAFLIVIGYFVADFNVLSNFVYQIGTYFHLV
ncbi:membrane associated rhomboid family serine protease [Filimonas zeae]|uniref:Rhomboid family intramembrane serine protease n=1 Tax=Filimonas zeae TaxID=1737353 RepID=A0A917ILM3_9BACT|nr:rhomboid family intramembrane serine protease [Filimonas zeae]MDR6337336.1 membrane associated rhomboid family serine protease [Filimonas zeae]GGH58112.1 rhomboid family intramembrane serine protease [Filimonas zeae]